ncbi:hypothetical protein M405DRAFT_824120 [Rhizopogon salebrosus TDB-379]|nr:hypothetical protein M405DRAFT_824120 [Rhizopogon salebrosus TDB-379]
MGDSDNAEEASKHGTSEKHLRASASVASRRVLMRIRWSKSYYLSRPRHERRPQRPALPNNVSSHCL